jgi:tRNA(fMet)-specific endonuclease VapC
VTYLLDTNICVFAIRQKSQRLLDRLRQTRPGDMAISTVTLAELRFGAEKSQDPPKNHAALIAFVAPLEIVPFDAAAADEYGRIRAHLEARGEPIGPLDTMIAAHALALGVPLVTNNVAEFTRVPGLTVEDWTAP